MDCGFRRRVVLLFSSVDVIRVCLPSGRKDGSRTNRASASSFEVHEKQNSSVSTLPL